MIRNISFKEILTYFCEELKMLPRCVFIFLKYFLCFKIIEKNTEQL